MATIKQLIHRGWCVLQTFDFVHAVFEPSFLMPFRQGGDRLRRSSPVVKHKKPFHTSAFDHQLHQITRAGWDMPLRVRAVVAGNHAAHGDPRFEIQEIQSRFECVTADVVEIHVDPVGTGSCESVNKSFFPAIVDCCIKAQLLSNPTALFVTAGYANDSTADDLADLPRQGADGAGRCRNENGFTWGWFRNIEHAKVRGHSNVTKQAQMK